MKNDRSRVGYLKEESLTRMKVVPKDENGIANEKTEERGVQMKFNVNNFSTQEDEKWALYISACGGYGFILKEEAKDLNLGPTGETRTLYNIPDAEGKVSYSTVAHTYEVYI